MRTFALDTRSAACLMISKSACTVIVFTLCYFEFRSHQQTLMPSLAFTNQAPPWGVSGEGTDKKCVRDVGTIITQGAVQVALWLGQSLDTPTQR